MSVQKGVLIPRPETEHIVDLVADVVLDDEGLREGLWADLGTGSGALAIGIGRILGSCEHIIPIKGLLRPSISHEKSQTQ